MSERLGIYTELELKAARDLVRELVRVVRSHRLYEGDHPTLAEMHVNLRKKWDAATAGGPLSLRLTERKVLLEDEAVLQGSGGPSEVLPTVLYEHGVVGFILKRGLEPSEARRFIEVLAAEPDPSVDYASLLWEADLKRVQVLLDFEDESEDQITTPREFADQVEALGDDKDPAVGDDYEEERAEARGEAELVGADYAPPTEAEQLYMRHLLDGDSYMSTVRHALHMVHNMASESITPEEAEGLERGLVALTGAVLASGDLEAALETLSRVRGMISSPHALEMRVAELTLQLFHERESLWAFFLRLDEHEYLDTRMLGEFLAQLGPPAAGTVGDWLMETGRPDAVSDAMRVFGEAATGVLVPLYEKGGALGRQRAGPALLEIGSPEALLAITAEFSELPKATRLKLLHLIGRSQDPALRKVVLQALDDGSEQIRRAAVGAVRKQDADEVARILEDFFERGVFESRYRQETEDFFEMLSRIGGQAVALLLADRCLPKGFRLGFRRLTETQQLCVRALRRMRSSEAKPIVEELKKKAPRAVRDILESPLV